MKKFETIEFEVKNSIGTIFMNRPDIHNAFNSQMIKDIIECFELLNNDKDVRVVVLRGRGKSFCAGADLNYMKSIATFGFEENYKDSLNLAKCFYTIYTCSKPTIAVVQGAAIGGANGLLASCDYAFCSDETTFSLSEIKIGLIPSCIGPYVTKRVGEYGARDLMLSGKRIKGKDAEYYRLVNKSLPPEKLDEYVDSAIALLMTSGPDAMSHCKKLIFDLSNKLTFEESIDYTARLIAEMRASKEGQEGMASFLEKRKPNWVK